MLFQTFAKDQAVRSTAFQAAGISGMQPLGPRFPSYSLGKLNFEHI